MRTAFLVALCAVLFVGAAVACPASYVQGLGQNNTNDPNYQKASQVADGYMNNRGINPQSPAGQQIKPYVTGTGLVEFSWSQNFKPNKTVEQLVDMALGPNKDHAATPNNDSQNGGHGTLPTHQHFDLHFGYAVGVTGTTAQNPTDKTGG